MNKELSILKAYIKGHAVDDIKNLLTPIQHEVVLPEPPKTFVVSGKVIEEVGETMVLKIDSSGGEAKIEMQKIENNH